MVCEVERLEAIELRCETAEAERDRLREALKQIEDLPPLQERERRTIAREALAGSRQECSHEWGPNGGCVKCPAIATGVDLMKQSSSE